MTAARPPGFSRRRKRARKSSSVFFVLTISEQVLGAVLVVEAAGEGRIGEDEGVGFFVARVILREGVAVADVGILHAVQEHVHAADAEHGVVEVEAVEGWWWKCFLSLASRRISGWCSRRYSPAATRKPEVPQAGSQMTSLGVGAVSSTMSWMMWRGVRNWPFWPALAILPEHVFVEVALGVAVLHRDVVDAGPRPWRAGRAWGW